jgi:xanthine dehydrogenase accessory factor
MEIPADFLSSHERCILIEVTATWGSTPREAGAFMFVSDRAISGTIGGGRMEHVAIALARSMLTDGREKETLDVTLGPDSGQCCGGRVSLSLSLATERVMEDLRLRSRLEADAFPDVFIFGAGHVGRALALALKPLPFNVMVVETREDEAVQLAPGIDYRIEAIAERAVADVRPGGAVVIVTHDHALDFLIGAEALRRADLSYIGMIGSKTKRGLFRHHLRDHGEDEQRIDRLVLPIGGTAVHDKRPPVIAALVAAELLNHYLGSC